MSEKKKKAKLIETSIKIEESQLEWLKKKNYDLSKVVRDYLNEFIASIDKTKSIVVPAFIKAPDNETLKKRMMENPRLRKLLEKNKE